MVHLKLHRITIRIRLPAQSNYSSMSSFPGQGFLIRHLNHLPQVKVKGVPIGFPIVYSYIKVRIVSTIQICEYTKVLHIDVNILKLFPEIFLILSKICCHTTWKQPLQESWTEIN